MTPPASALLIVATLLAAACAELPPIPAGTCGNGVLDEGEACDTFADDTLGPGLTCGGCRYVCGEGLSCPPGWGCGARDAVCRAPTGTFEELIERDFPTAALDLHTVEIDGDGHLDLVGHTGAQVWARFGDGDGGFSAPTGFAVDVALSSLAFGDLDEDGRSDVVIPVPAGFVTLIGDAGRELVPVSASVYGVGFSGGVGLLPIRYDAAAPFAGLLVVSSDGAELELRVNLLDPTRPTVTSLRLPEPRPLADLVAIFVTDLDADPTALGVEELVLAFARDPRVQVLGASTSADLPVIVPRTEVVLPEPVEEGGLLVADVDHDGVRDLVAVIGGGVVVARGDGAGGFGPPTRDARFDALGAAPRPLVGADVNADGRTDWVDPWGVWLDLGGTLVQTAWNVSGAPWAFVVTADLDRDGVTDVVASTGGLSLEVLRGSRSGFFSRAHVVTEGLPRSLRAGDFDGDRIEDVAVLERHADEDTLTVLFGATDGRANAPVEMGDFPLVHRIEPAFISVGRSTTDATADLFVQNAEGPDPAAVQSLAIFVGSSERRMLAPFNLGADPFALALGDLAPDDERRADVIAFTPVGAILAPGAGEGRFRAEDLAFLGPFGADPAVFDGASARFATADLDGDGVDEVVAIDHGVVRADPEVPRLAIARVVPGAGPLELPSLATTIAPLDGHLAPGPLALVDVDADGARDLVVVFRGDVRASGDEATGAGAVVFWNEGGTFDPATASVVPTLPGALRLLGATTIAADEHPARELVVATDVGLFLVPLVSGTRTFASASAPMLDAVARFVLAADVTSDGLEDLLVYDGLDVFLYGALPREP